MNKAARIILIIGLIALLGFAAYNIAEDAINGEGAFMSFAKYKSTFHTVPEREWP